VDGTDRGDEAVIAAVRKYRVWGFPTVIFFDSSGNEIQAARVTGFVDSEEFLKRIEAVK
jgi:thiol:disulfide interchange protein DsbD